MIFIFIIFVFFYLLYLAFIFELFIILIISKIIYIIFRNFYTIVTSISIMFQFIIFIARPLPSSIMLACSSNQDPIPIYSFHQLDIVLIMISLMFCALISRIES